MEIKHKICSAVYFSLLKNKKIKIIGWEVSDNILRDTDFHFHILNTIYSVWKFHEI